MKKQIIVLIIVLVLLISIVNSIDKNEKKYGVVIKFKDPNLAKAQILQKLNSTELLELKKTEIDKSRKKFLTRILDNKGIKIKRAYNLTNTISASVTQAVYDNLKHNSNVEFIEEEFTLSILMDDVKNIVHPDSFWDIENLSVNGTGETVCVIDTGVDYTHQNLGGCNIINNSYQGNVVNYNLSSNHSYENNLDITYTINSTGFTNIAVHFVNISLESEWDFIEILDSNNNSVALYTGEMEDVWSPTINGDTLKLKFESDSNTVDWGFLVDKIINGTVNTTLNWSNCQKVLGGWDISQQRPTFDNDNPMDDEGHGTHVSGIIASTDATYKGIAPGAKIFAVKAMDETGDGNFTDVMAAYEFCIENQNRFNISVISMSVGFGSYSSNCDSSNGLFQVFSDLVDEAYSLGIMTVASSGNSGSSTGIAFPACLENVTAVSATSKLDIVDTSYANTNSLVDLLAPGTSIISLNLGGGFTSKTGTSMSAPVVSGAALLLRNFKRNENGSILLPEQIRQILINTGDNITDARNSVIMPRINLTNALNYIDDIPRFNFISGNITGNITTNQTYINFTTTEKIVITNLTINDISYNFNGSVNNFYYNLTNLSDGLHTLKINITDTTNNIETYILYFNIDHVKPNITNVTDTSISTSSHKIEWNTTEGTNTTLVYGNETNLYQNNITNANYTFNHSMTLLNLESNKTYFYYILSYDHVNLFNQSIEFNFTTALPDSVPPIINLTYPNNNSVINQSYLIDLNFTTNENTTCNYYINQTINITGPLNYSTNFSYFNNTNFNLSINCTDSFNNSAYYLYSYTINDTTKPNVSNIVTSATTSAITVTFAINEPSNATISSVNATNYDLSKSLSITGLSSSTAYNFNLTVCDKLRNCNVTSISKTTLTPTPTPTSSGGGGSSSRSSSSGGGSISITTKSVTLIAQKLFTTLSTGSNDMEINNDAIALNKVTLNIKDEVKTASLLKVQVTNNPPEKVENSYQYLQIESEHDEFLSVDIYFSVNKSWIIDNNIDPLTIELLRYEQNWTRLDTYLEGNDTDLYYYKSETPGFSYFAISGETVKEEIIEESITKNDFVTDEKLEINKDEKFEFELHNDEIIKNNDKKPVNYNGYMISIMILTSFVFFMFITNNDKSDIKNINKKRKVTKSNKK
jgi:PGF-pre-PGF domain-containing protein